MLKSGILFLALAIIGCQQSSDPVAKQIQRTGAAIPAAFRGLWLANQKSCNGSEWREGYLITADTIRMSKSAAPLKVSAVNIVKPTDAIVATTDPSAGWSFDGKFRFVVNGSGKVLSNVYDNRTASFDYLKCETS